MTTIDIPSVFAIAVGLSADCFAVALGGSIAVRSLPFPSVFRASLAFGLFQGLMPLLGWLVGRTVVGFIADYDHWVAFTLLMIVGGRMIWESFRDKEGASESRDVTKGFLLLTLAVATSIDALAVGLSFAFMEVDITLVCSVIGVVAFTASTIGFLLGRKVGRLVGRRAEALGGLVLIAISLRILLSHLL